MKKNNKKIKNMIAALGAGSRAVYLENNPHGFAANHKVHKSKKSYKRDKKVSIDD